MLVIICVMGCRSHDTENTSFIVDDSIENQKGTVKFNNKVILSSDSMTTEVLPKESIIKPIDTIPAVYKSVIDSLARINRGSISHSEYFLYDITGNGLPELWIKSGACEADYQMMVYTIDGSKSLRILDSYGGHTDYLLADGNIASVTCNTGSGYVSLYHFNGKKITEQSAEFSMWNDEGRATAINKNEQKIVDIWNDSVAYITMKQLR